MYLLDTNVISEIRKGIRMNAGVRAFAEDTHEAQWLLSVLTLGEIRSGIERLHRRGDSPGAEYLETWLKQLLLDFAERILDFDRDSAAVWGRLMAADPSHTFDKQIAAIALVYDLTVVTRNTNDFTATGCKVHNPFT